MLAGVFTWLIEKKKQYQEIRKKYNQKIHINTLYYFFLFCQIFYYFSSAYSVKIYKDALLERNGKCSGQPRTKIVESGDLWRIYKPYSKVQVQ